MHTAMNKQPCDFQEKSIYKFTFFLNINKFFGQEKVGYHDCHYKKAIHYFCKLRCFNKSFKHETRKFLHNILQKL